MKIKFNNKQMEAFARLTTSMVMTEVTLQPEEDEHYVYKLLTCKILAKFLREKVAPAIILPAQNHKIKMNSITATAWLAAFQNIDITELGDSEGTYFINLAHDIELNLQQPTTTN